MADSMIPDGLVTQSTDASQPVASSRIFIKGLPPTISEEEFKKHFSSKYATTDAKLISNRRIGYIGYKSPDDAVKAVKYYNRTYIRMSKIGVEIARPVRRPWLTSYAFILTSLLDIRYYFTTIEESAERESTRRGCR